MCEQCIVNPFYFNNFMPVEGHDQWSLIKARREGNEMELGDWGIVVCNGPSFIFEFDFNNLESESNESIYSYFLMHPTFGHEFVIRAKSLGYENGCLVKWFINYTLEFIVVTIPALESDPFPHLDAVKEHDYSEWVAPK